MNILFPFSFPLAGFHIAYISHMHINLFLFFSFRFDESVPVIPLLQESLNNPCYPSLDFLWFYYPFLKWGIGLHAVFQMGVCYPVYHTLPRDALGSSSSWCSGVSLIRTECSVFSYYSSNDCKVSFRNVTSYGARCWLCIVKVVSSLVKGIRLLLGANLSQGIW